MKKFKFNNSDLGRTLSREELKHVLGGENNGSASCSWTGSECKLVHGDASQYHCFHSSYSYNKGSAIKVKHICQAIPNGN